MSYVQLSFYAAEFSISSGFIMFDILISSTLNEYEGKRIKNPGTSFLLSCVINMLRCCIVLAPVVLRCCISMIHSSYNVNCWSYAVEVCLNTLCMFRMIAVILCGGSELWAVLALLPLSVPTDCIAADRPRRGRARTRIRRSSLTKSI